MMTTENQEAAPEFIEQNEKVDAYLEDLRTQNNISREDSGDNLYYQPSPPRSSSVSFRIPIIATVAELLVGFFCDINTSPVKSLKRVAILLLAVSAIMYFKGHRTQSTQILQEAEVSSAVTEAQIEALKNSRTIAPSRSRSPIISVYQDKVITSQKPR